MMIEGTVFAGRYRIVRCLGAGGMGAVYEAVDTETTCHVALKVMHVQIGKRADLRERFEREAKALARVKSTFVVAMLGAGVDAATGTPYLVMELLRGENLKCRLEQEGPFSPAEAVGYLAQVAHGLDAVHREQIVHRDLKPSNLFVEDREDEGRHIKIVDFGIVKILDETTVQDSTAAVGTRAYMAPEQHRGDHITYRVDIYALGMLAFTLLVGRPYWEDELEKYGESYQFGLTVVSGLPEPANVRAMRRGVTLDSRFDRWFARATALDPARRFRSATNAIGALAKALDVPGFEDLVKQAEDDIDDVPEPSIGPTHEEPAWDRTKTEPGARLPSDRLATDPSARSPQLSSTTAQSIKSSNTDAVTQPQARNATVLPAWLTGRTGRILALIGLIAAAFVGVSFWPKDPPLKLPSSILACPPLEASGDVDKPAGWLGAAAAAVFCERARVVLGGKPERTLLPAELLGLPREPTDSFPEDPYTAPDARGQALTAARERAAAYIDGQVVRIGSSFHITISVHRADGTEIGRGGGEGRGLYEAVRATMTPLISKGILPKADHLDPAIADFSGARDVDGALLFLDTWLAVTQNAGSLPEECNKMEVEKEDLAEMRPVMAHVCAYTLGMRGPVGELPPNRTISPGSQATGARYDHYVRRVDPPDIIAVLERLYKEERSPSGQSTLATTASCLLQSSESTRAMEMSLRAVRADPKNPIGEFCAPWPQLVAVTRGTPTAASTLHAMQAWQPWVAHAWLLEEQPNDTEREIQYVKRAYTLSPFNTQAAAELVSRLLASGKPREAYSIAVALADGGYPVHRVESDVLLLQMEASDANFKAAMERAKRAMKISEEDGGWVRAQRIKIAWHAIEVGLILGRASEIADLAVQRFLDPEPPLVDGGYFDTPLQIAAICAYASKAVSRRCVARFRAVRDKLSGSILPDTDTFLLGAERYAQGDFAGAAKAWRPLLRDPGPFVEVLGEAMATTFEAVGEDDLAERIDAAIPAGKGYVHGASLTMVRAARRAAKRGDNPKANELAEKVIGAWRFAKVDDTIPAVQEMQKLQEKLRGTR